jgi:hypothetical protein
MYTKITFETPINSSLQMGDAIYFSQTNVGSPIVSEPTYVGLVHRVFTDDRYIVVAKDPAVPPIVSGGDFILFAKDVGVNEAGLKGYYADVTFENASTTRSELFSFGSEITLSSK